MNWITQCVCAVLDAPRLIHIAGAGFIDNLLKRVDQVFALRVDIQSGFTRSAHQHTVHSVHTVCNGRVLLRIIDAQEALFLEDVHVRFTARVLAVSDISEGLRTKR